MNFAILHTHTSNWGARFLTSCNPSFRLSPGGFITSLWYSHNYMHQVL